MIYLLTFLVGFVSGYMIRGNNEYQRGKIEEYERIMDDNG